VKQSICKTKFLAKPAGGTLTTSDESLEVGFFPIEKAQGMVTTDQVLSR
jgi:8-oxo-dGTP diphosphatase